MADEETTIHEEATIYREKLGEIVDVPAPDDLVQGATMTSEIKISTAGTYKRGELLISTGDNEFQTALPSNLQTAKEICILTRDCEVAEGNDYWTAGYFTGTFNGSAIVLSYETENDDHAELIAEVKVALRRCAIYII